MPKYKIVVICIAIAVLLWQGFAFVDASAKYQRGMSSAASHEGKQGLIFNDSLANSIKTTASTRYNADYKKSLVITMITVATTGLILLLPNRTKKEA